MNAYRITESCPRCQSLATTSDGTCQTCGHIWGSQHRCVHCGVSCAVRPHATYGPTCSRCGVPRIAGDWQMPGSTATLLRRAVAQRKARGRAATLAILVAIACVPVGPLAADYVGFAGWFAVLLVWFASVAVAGGLRASGRRSLARQIARARSEWAASTPRVRVEVAAPAGPSAGDNELDEELDEPDLAARRV